MYNSDIQSGYTVVILALLTPPYFSVVSFATLAAGRTEQTHEQDLFCPQSTRLETNSGVKRESVNLSVNFRWLCVPFVRECVISRVQVGFVRCDRVNGMLSVFQYVADILLYLGRPADRAATCILETKPV